MRSFTTLKSKIDAALKENEKTDKEQKLLVALKNYMNNLYQEKTMDKIGLALYALEAYTAEEQLEALKDFIKFYGLTPELDEYANSTQSLPENVVKVNFR